MSTTRRAFATGMAATTMAAPAAMAATATDPHPEWMAELRRLIAVKDAIYEAAPDSEWRALEAGPVDEVWRQIDAMSEKVCRTRAHTLDGLRTQAAALARNFEICGIDDDETTACLANMRATLATLA